MVANLLRFNGILVVRSNFFTVSSLKVNYFQKLKKSIIVSAQNFVNTTFYPSHCFVLIKNYCNNQCLPVSNRFLGKWTTSGNLKLSKTKIHFENEKLKAEKCILFYNLEFILLTILLISSELKSLVFSKSRRRKHWVAWKQYQINQIHN